MATISLCMIVQDEEMCVGRAIDSVIDYVDEFIVLDSGSTDATLEIVATYPKTQIFHHPLDGDFGAQRNRCIEHASCEWIVFIDADETFDYDLVQSLRRLSDIPSYDAYGFQRRTRIDGYLANIFNHDFQVRMFKNVPHIRYSGKIHEAPTGYNALQLCNLSINHDKTAEWQNKDNERVWNMGQTPPPGWVKQDGVWVYDEATNPV